jgi:hypothetical protein
MELAGILRALVYAGRMRPRGLACSCVLALLIGCGGSVDRSVPKKVVPSAGSGGASLEDAGGLGGATPDAGTGGAPAQDAGIFIDPGCPDAAPPAPDFQCDPLASPTGCTGGLACFPFLIYPNDTGGCGFPLYGAACSYPGTGMQGDPCGDEYGQCAAGYMCVVGAKPGKRCTKICRLTGDDGCPPGFICAETDIEGIGVCV